MSRSLLDVRDLTVDYGRTRVVHGVDFCIESGRVVALVGESGSGKSSVLRAIAGLEPGAGGTVLLNGRDFLGMAERQRRSLRAAMQVVFQDPYGSLDPRLTVGETVLEPLRAAGNDMSREEGTARAEALLAEVGLPDTAHRYPHVLSGGQRQRVAIARAIATRPELVLLDEPVSALDVSVQARILRLLADLRDRHGLAYLFVSHDLAIVRSMADEVIVMKDGRVVEQGPAKLLDDPAHEYTRALADAVPRSDPSEQRARLRGGA